MVEARTNGWERAPESQRASWRALSHADRLRWLWEAKLFAGRAVEAAARRRSGRATTLGKPANGEPDDQ